MSAVSMPGYQKSAAGCIPADWSPLPLGAVASVRKDKGVAQQGVPCVELEHIEPETGRLLGWDSSGTQASIKTAFKRGDVLFGKLRPYLRKYAVAPFDGICTTEILAVYPRDEHSDSQFLFHLMQGDGVFATVEALSYGTKMPRVSWTDLSDIVLCIPPLPEQQKIAAILTAVDDKLDVIARQIEATQTLKRGLLQTLFSRGVGTQDADGRWIQHTEFKRSELGKVPATWSIRTLGSVTEEVKKRNFGMLDDALLCGVLKEQGLMPMRERVKGAKTERCRVVWPNAFAYNPMRINIGSIARNLRDHSVMVSPDYVVFATRTDELLPDYLDHFRRSEEWQRFVGRSGDGGVRIRIYYDDLAQLWLKVPPLPEQEKIVEILDGLTAKLSHLASKHAHYQTLKHGLMQKLLTGEWRVNVATSASDT